jgi:hypothetical protein
LSGCKDPTSRGSRQATKKEVLYTIQSICPL